MPKRGRKSDATGRSKGVERHVRLHYWVLQCQAYRSLRPTARALLVELYALFNNFNNGQLFLSVREAATKLNVSPNTAMKAFAELVGHGFIKPHVKGAFTLKERHATSWILTEFSHANQLPEKTFMRWPAQIQKPVAKFQADCVKFCDSDNAKAKVLPSSVAMVETEEPVLGKNLH